MHHPSRPFHRSRYPNVVRGVLLTTLVGAPAFAAAADGVVPLSLLACDVTADRIIRLSDMDGSGAVEASVAGEISIFYDDSGPGPDLSTAAHLAAGPPGTVYLLDGGTLDSILSLTDRNGDGDANDAGEVSVFYDGSAGGPALATPNTLVPAPGGGFYVSDDGSRARRILYIEDLDGDGDALGAGEARIVYDASAASMPLLGDVEALVATAGGILFAADSGLQAIYALRDVDGDGGFFAEEEVSLFYEGSPEAMLGDVETLTVQGDALLAWGRKGAPLLRLVDSNGDGDALDEGEATVALDMKSLDVVDVAALPDGVLAVLDNEADTILLALDGNGDGDFADEGEVVPWLRDGGVSLSLPSGILLAPPSTQPPPGSNFLRGDSSRDGKVDVSDPIATLDFLFLGGGGNACADAMDCDDDGQVTISDPIGCLNFLFLGGPPPAPPYPAEGTDPTPDPLECT